MKFICPGSHCGDEIRLSDEKSAQSYEKHRKTTQNISAVHINVFLALGHFEEHEKTP